jgi:hypothetical protein
VSLSFPPAFVNENIVSNGTSRVPAPPAPWPPAPPSSIPPPSAIPAPTPELLPPAVLDAIERDWKIYPVKRGTKDVALTQWRLGGPDEIASSDPARITRWALQHGNCNWGLATGKVSKVWVADTDNPKAHQYAVDNSLTNTRRVKSGSATKQMAYHYYHEQPPDIEVQCSTGKLFPGLDIKGDGGMVLLPGSQHPDGPLYVLEDDRDPASTPEAFLPLVKKLPEPPPIDLSDLEPLTDAQKELGRRVFDNKCKKYADVPDGQWNPELTRLTFKAGQMIAREIFTAEEAEAKILAIPTAAVYMAEKPRVVKKNIARGFKKGARKPWDPTRAEEHLQEKLVERFGPPGSAKLPDGAISPEVYKRQQQAQSVAISEKLAAERAQVLEEPKDSSWQLPEGLLGDVANFIYRSAYKPNQEVALAGAITFLAGITGRQYNTSTSTGLNQYVVLLAETSRGKEGAARGIGKLKHAIEKINLSLNIDQFMGPASIASAPALKKQLAQTECFYTSMGEVGKTLQKMTGRNANPNDIELMGALMDLYMKSGKYDSLRATIYSDKGQNIPKVQSPCVSIIGDSTPGDFYKAMTLSDFASGLIPRLTIIEHIGRIPPTNKQHKGVIPTPDLVKRLIKLIQTVTKLQQSGHKVIEVEMSPEAQAFTDKFEADYERKIEQHPGPLAQLWSRSHLRLLRLASLVAVGALDWSNERADFTCVIPTVTLPMVEWAADLIIRSNEIVERRVATGGIGQTGEADEQRQAIESCIRRFFKGKYKATWEKSYGVTEAMHAAGHVSFRFIRNATVNLKCFSSQDYGRSSAGILRNLVDAEYIKPLSVTNSTNGTTSQQYQILTIEGLHEGEA